MKAALFASVVSTASAGGTLGLTWSDCGTSTTHGKTTDVEPSTLALGEETAITGTGTLDKDVTGGTYDMELKAGGGIIDSHFTGNNCEAKSFTLPLGLGTLDWDGLSCPQAAGTASIGFKTKLAAALPPALATSTIDLKAQDQDSEDLLCVNLKLAEQEAEEEPEVNGGTVDLTWKDCGDASTHGKISGIDKTTITLGEDTTVTGSGTVDEDITAGAFTITAKAGLITQKYDGDVCAAKEFDLPLGLGKINWQGLSCPAAAGDLSVAVDVKLASVIPASLAKADITLAATGTSDDDKLLCMTLHAEASASSFVV